MPHLPERRIQVNFSTTHEPTRHHLDLTQTLAIVSQKGGVGKTTIAVNLAYALAARSWKVLIIDADPQSGVAASISRKARKAQGFYDFLTGKAERNGRPAKPEELIMATRLPELTLMPAGSQSADGFFEEIPAPSQLEMQLRRLLSNLMTRLPLDAIIIDTPTLSSPITRAIGAVSGHLLIPQQNEPLSQRGISSALQFVATLREKNPEAAKLAGILLTMADADDPESLDLQGEFRMLLPADFVLDTVIPRDSNFVRASRAGVPVALLRQKPPAAALVFDQLAAELESRLGLAIESEINDPVQNNDFTRLMD